MEQFVSGTVIATDIQSGISKAGREWRKLVFVVEFMEGTYTKHLAFEMFGDERINNNPVKKGQTVTVHYDVESTEWNGRWFTTANAWKVEPLNPTTGTVAAPEPVAIAPNPDDDLPF